MKQLTTIFLTPIILFSNLFAESTLCFKKNLKNNNNIEQLNLNGGNCKGAYTLNEMKNDGWIIKEEIISQNKSNYKNYLFILEKTENKKLYFNNIKNNDD